MPIFQSNMTRTEIEHLIDQHIFNERNRALYKRRVLDGILLEPLAEEFDLSVRQTQNIIYKCNNILLETFL